MATTPQFNIKVGSDSTLSYSREETDAKKATVGKILDSATNGSDVWEYPILSRRTGHSIKGTTESIESSELRKGRTKSAPRKGNSSSEGDLDFEYSPETYDDFLEACFRSAWTDWKSDTDSESNIVEAGETKPECADNQFRTQMGDPLYADGTKYPMRYLLGNIGTTAPDGKKYAIEVTDATQYEVHELCPSTKDIKYDMLVQYGGLENEDLYQDFEHMAVGSMSLSMTPGEIVTGSFGFMGSNNPDLLNTDDEAVQLETRFETTKTEDEAKEWLANLPKKGTNTDQSTANESDVYVCGEQVQYSSDLSFSLDNGLKKIYAIGEKDSISTMPLSLDINGSFTAYLIAGKTEYLSNLRTQDKNVEMIFTVKDKKEDPEYAYLFQVFETKFSGNDISTGSEELTIDMPYDSFGERACRIFRLRKRRLNKVALAYDESGDVNEIDIQVSSVSDAFATTDIVVTATLDGVDVTTDVVGTVEADTEEKCYKCSLTKPSGTGVLAVTVTYNGSAKTVSTVLA